MAYYAESKIYDDTVEIVKAAVSSSTEGNITIYTDESISNYIKTVFQTLKEINEQLKD